jgi:hypothetical protein
MRPILAAIAAIACAGAAAAQPAPAPGDGPAVTREADGSFTIRRAIEAEGPATAAHGLVELGAPGRAQPSRSESRRRAREKADEDLRRAYEEAVDWARR